MRISAKGPLPADEVWRRYTTVEEWSTWAPHIRSVSGMNGAIRGGSAGVVHGVGGLHVPFEVVSVDPARREWIWLVGPGAVSLRMRHQVETCDQGSVASMTVERPRWITPVYAPMAWCALRRLVQ